MVRQTRNTAAIAGPFCGVVAGLAITAGCATPPKKLDGETMAPFAEQTLTMLGDTRFGLQDVSTILIRKYVEDGQSPRYEAFRESWSQVGTILRAVVTYSIEAVDLAQQSSGEESSAALAESLQRLVTTVRAQSAAEPHLKDFPYDDVIAAVGRQKEFMPALQAAQPAADDIARVVTRMLNQLQSRVDESAGEIEGEIAADHAAVLAARSRLLVRQSDIVTDLAVLDRVRAGDEAALDELLAKDAELRRRLAPRAEAATADRAEDVLVERLNRIDTVRQRIEPEFELYQAKLRELQDASRLTSDAIRRAEISTVLWSRSHRRFAAGKPSEFNINNLTNTLLKYAL